MGIGRKQQILARTAASSSSQIRVPVQLNILSCRGYDQFEENGWAVGRYVPSQEGIQISPRLVWDVGRVSVGVRHG